MVEKNTEGTQGKPEMKIIQGAKNAISPTYQKLRNSLEKDVEQSTPDDVEKFRVTYNESLSDIAKECKDFQEVFFHQHAKMKEYTEGTPGYTTHKDLKDNAEAEVKKIIAASIPKQIQHMNDKFEEMKKEIESRVPSQSNDNRTELFTS